MSAPRRRRRMEIRARLAVGIVRAVERNGPMHNAAIANALGVAPTYGTLHYARRELLERGVLRTARRPGRDRLDRPRSRDLYYLPGQLLPPAEPEFEVIPLPPPAVLEPEGNQREPCGCGSTVVGPPDEFGDRYCVMCGHAWELAA